ncbi:MAG TPA: 6-carboxytetrahydropterin synthase QueD [Bryobacteraceae bacterium]|nr:6-carboxytetrahydropterin synthase QueD [Bryobacteraceae bacterium]
MFEVTVEQTFAAGHALRNYHGKSEDIHGHNYRVRVTVEGAQLDSTGLLVDFLEVNRLITGAVAYLDHRFINDLKPFDELNPSAENIAKYFYEKVNGGLQNEVPVRISAVQVWETDTSSAIYRP